MFRMALWSYTTLTDVAQASGARHIIGAEAERARLRRLGADSTPAPEDEGDVLHWTWYSGQLPSQALKVSVPQGLLLPPRLAEQMRSGTTHP